MGVVGTIDAEAIHCVKTDCSWRARPSLWASPRRALIASRSASSKVKNTFSSKSPISRGSSRMPKNVECQPRIVNPINGRPRYPFTK